MEQFEDRRRHTRFDMSSAPSQLWFLTAGSDDSAESCRLLNLSFGGMCFASEHSFEQEKIYPFRIRLADLDPEAFAVKAEIRWVEHQDAGWVMGAEFRESSKGWVGPDEKS